MRFAGVLCLIMVIGVCGFVNAQYSTSGLDLKKDVEAWYDQVSDFENSGVIAGNYRPVSRITKSSHQFYLTDNWVSSTIEYRGQVYTNIFLLYDTYNDLLYMRHPTNYYYHGQAIELIQSEVKSFEFMEHHFEFIDRSIMIFRPGIYDILHEGEHFSLIAKRKKQDKVDRTLEYYEADVYLIKFNGEYHRAKTKAAFNRVLKPRKKEINAFVKKNKLKVNADNESDMILLAEYCDKLLSDK